MRRRIPAAGILLVVVDIDGKAMLINLPRRALLHRINFKARVLDLQFSPDGRHLAVTHNRQLHLWLSPAARKVDSIFRALVYWPQGLPF